VLTFALLFLIPYRQKIIKDTYNLNIIISILFLIAGIITGWCMQNLSVGMCALLCCYFILKFIRKEKICLFEISGMIGLLTGFYFLLAASDTRFSGLMALVVKFIKVTIDFIHYCGILTAVLIIIGLEVFFFRKNKIDIIPLGYFLLAIISFFSLTLGYVKPRIILTPIVFLLISILNLLKYWQGMPKRYLVFAYILLFFLFLPSFYNGSKEIVKGYLFSKAREEFIYSEMERGISDIYVKTPIAVQNSYSGLYDGIDILENADEDEYKIHNTAKSLFYDIHSLTGVNTNNEANLRKSFKEFIEKGTEEYPSTNKLFAIIYKNWGNE
jgi:hypothetical protein